MERLGFYPLSPPVKTSSGFIMLHALQLLQIQGKLGTAEENFRRILSSTPYHIHARIGLGYCAWLKGDRAHAEKFLQETAELDLVNEEAILDCSTALAYVGMCQNADALLARKPQTSSLLACRGTIAEQRGDVRGAILFYEKALQEGTMPSQAIFHQLITLCRRVGHFDSALALADRLEAIYPDRSVTAAHSRGQTLLAQSRSDEAVLAFQAGLAHDPAAESCLLALAREWRRLGQFLEADALLKNGPETPNVLLERSNLALARRDADTARHHAEAANRLLPKGPEALVRLCRIEIDQGRYDEARAVASRIPGKGVEHRLQYFRALIEVAWADEDNQEAKTLLAQLVALQPMDTLARVDLARAWRRLGNATEAAAELTHVLNIDPRCVSALCEVGDQAQRDRNYTLALQCYRRALDVAPDQISHHLRLARLLQTMGSDEQHQVIALCKARFGNHVELISDHIRRLRETGRLEEALAAAREAFAAYPGIFGLWHNCFDLTLRLRPVALAEELLTRIPVQNRREEFLVASQHSLLAIRLHQRDEARSILEKRLLRDPNNRSYLNELFLLSLWRNDLLEATKLHLRLAKLSRPERLMIGETTNASQSHNGQMVNDMRLDAPAMAALDKARGGTSRDQIHRIMELVRERPDHIPTAQALVVTLAETKRFAPPPLCAAIPAKHEYIPSRIAQYWDEDVLPADLCPYSESWREINPGYAYQLFSDKTARIYLSERFPPSVLQAYLRVQDATTRADLFRLAVLTQDGGIWSDIDDRCTKPIGKLFRPTDRAVFWQERSGHICNNFMAAAPNHPILRRALVTAVNAINRGDNDKVWMLTGPGLITRCFAQEMAAAGEAWTAWLDQVNVVDEFDLWPVVAMHCIAVYKLQGRHWHKEAFLQRKAKRNEANSTTKDVIHPH